MRKTLKHKTAVSKGFTLMELMIVVAILSLIALIVIPKMANMIRKANEAGTMGHLSHFRGAIRLYYMDNENIFPLTLIPLLTPGNIYLTGAKPLVYTREHGNMFDIDVVPALNNNDNGRWGYVFEPSSLDVGHLWIQCTHTDMKGTIWSHY